MVAPTLGWHLFIIVCDNNNDSAMVVAPVPVAVPVAVVVPPQYSSPVTALRFSFRPPVVATPVASVLALPEGDSGDDEDDETVAESSAAEDERFLVVPSMMLSAAAAAPASTLLVPDRDRPRPSPRLFAPPSHPVMINHRSKKVPTMACFM